MLLAFCKRVSLYRENEKPPTRGRMPCNLFYSPHHSHFSLNAAVIIIINGLIGEKVEIFNQVAETLKVRDLATLIAGKTGVEIRNLENPRKEDAENELQVRAARSY